MSKHACYHRITGETTQMGAEYAEYCQQLVKRAVQMAEELNINMRDAQLVLAEQIPFPFGAKIMRDSMPATRGEPWPHHLEYKKGEVNDGTRWLK